MSNPNSTLYGGEEAEVDAARKYTQANGLPDPYRAYAAQRNMARVREIEWGFTFAGWWAIWQPYFHMRGRGTNDLCMARDRDDGPYSPGNVYLTTHLGNARDYHRDSEKAVKKRQLLKEAKEMLFARSTSTSKYGKTDNLSHITFKAFNTSKSTCNFKDEALE